VAPVDISAGDWKAIEATTGPLSDVERKTVANLCAYYRTASQMEDPKAADVKNTLEALLKISSDVAAVRAMRACDDTTHALLQEALYEMDGPDLSVGELRAAKIHAAALLVKHRLPKGKGGAPKKWWRRKLAKWVLDYCAKHGLSTKVHSFEGNSTPPVVLLMALLGVVESASPQEDTAAVKILLKVMKQDSA
jgi:hypothetical protein